MPEYVVTIKIFDCPIYSSLRSIFKVEVISADRSPAGPIGVEAK